MSTAADIDRFYALAQRLGDRSGGVLPLRALLDRPLPRAGVYIFFEMHENRGAGQGPPRIVRIGTHGLRAGSKSTLGGRLRQHLGQRNGNGNHRGSIFRLLVGEALMRRGDLDPVPSWGQGSDLRQAAARTGMEAERLRRQESAVEQRVSAVIGAMPVLVLGIDDEPGPGSLRGFIERNTIGLLSSEEARAIDPPSSGWLGSFSSRDRVRASGLWNSNHAGDPWQPAFLATLEDLSR